MRSYHLPLAIALLFLFPIANATHWENLSPVAPTNIGILGTSRSLNTSETYVITGGLADRGIPVGCAEGSGKGYRITDGSGNVFVVDKLGTVTTTGSFTTLTLLRHVNVSGGGFYFQMKVNFTPGGATTTVVADINYAGCVTSVPFAWGTWSDSQVASGQELECTLGTVDDAQIVNTSALTNVEREAACWKSAALSQFATTWAQYFIEEPPAPGTFPVSLTLWPISQSELLARWTIDYSASSYTTYLSQTPGFLPGPTTYAANTTQLSGSFTGLNSGYTYCAQVQSFDSAGVLINSSNEACASTLAPALTFYGNTTRVVPNNVTISITRPIGLDYLVDCVRFDPSGAVQNACVTTAWPATDTLNNYTFRYPQSVLSNTSQGDVGTYLLYVVNMTGTYVGGQTFCIQSSWSASCNVTVGTDLQTQLGTASVGENAGIVANNQAANDAATELTVRGAFLNFMAFAFREDIFIPNLAWWYFGTMLIAAFGVFNGYRNR